MNKFDGLPKESDFKIEKHDLGQLLEDGEILYESEFISVDPYQRRRADALKVCLLRKIAYTITRLFSAPGSNDWQ